MGGDDWMSKLRFYGDGRGSLPAMLKATRRRPPASLPSARGGAHQRMRPHLLPARMLRLSHHQRAALTAKKWPGYCSRLRRGKDRPGRAVVTGGGGDMTDVAEELRREMRQGSTERRGWAEKGEAAGRHQPPDHLLASGHREHGRT
ncbi:unnamed protein product [Urochloa humidicola]